MKTLTSIPLLFFSISTLVAGEPLPFFQTNPQQPYHLSIGGVLFDDQGRIACHHFDNFFGNTDIYILMRESMENDETPLMTLHRGLKEEFGATAQPIAFLGSLCGYLPEPHLSFEKTTVYVACQLLQWHPEERNLIDVEAGSTIHWLQPDALILLMQEQGKRFPHRIDLDESEIVKRILPLLPDASQ